MSESPEPIDPLAETVAMLRPSLSISKLVHAAGRWVVRRTDAGRSFHCAVLEGTCRLTVRGREAIVLAAGDFVLVPAAREYAVSSLPPPVEGDDGGGPVLLRPGEVRLGRADGPADLRVLLGHCAFGAPDAALIVGLLPELVVVRGGERLQTLCRLLDDEARERRPGREMILERLLEVLLIEAMRAAPDGVHDGRSPPGLVRGLADRPVAAALRAMHETPAHPWTVAGLAREATLSRTVFFERFRRTVGVTPMTYLFTWRMALARQLLRDGAPGMETVAERVGYGSASTFSIAFARHVGVPPARWAREFEETGALPNDAASGRSDR